MTFKNRKQAGGLLAHELTKYRNADCIVLALPRGGVPVAKEISTSLKAPLSILAVRKVGAPFQPELAVGAICEDGEVLWNQRILSSTGLSPDDLGGLVKKEKAKVKEQIQKFRQGRPLPDLKGKTAILVDDGVATGATMMAAILYLKNKGAARVVAAAPVASTRSARQMKSRAHDFVTLRQEENFDSVGSWYEDFSEVSDEMVSCLLRRARRSDDVGEARAVSIPCGSVSIQGDLTEMASAQALIVFAHGSGSSRNSVRNQSVARTLNASGFSTLLLDLLTPEEEKDRKNTFNISLLAERLVRATHWVKSQDELKELALGFFGASTGAGAAILAASKLPRGTVYAIVSRGGRPDLAGSALEFMEAPTLLLVGGEDLEALEINLHANKILPDALVSIVPGATHLFGEPNALEEVAHRATFWFEENLDKVLTAQIPKDAPRTAIFQPAAVKESTRENL